MIREFHFHSNVRKKPTIPYTPSLIFHPVPTSDLSTLPKNPFRRIIRRITAYIAGYASKNHTIKDS